MPLTLNQFLLLVITIAIVVGVTFLVSLVIQLRKTAKEGEGALSEIRELVQNLKETNKKVNEKIDELGVMVEATKKTAISVSQITWFLATKVIKPSSKYWPIVFPLLRLGWRQIKKRKEGKRGKQ